MMLHCVYITMQRVVNPHKKFVIVQLFSDDDRRERRHHDRENGEVDRKDRHRSNRHEVRPFHALFSLVQVTYFLCQPVASAKILIFHPKKKKNK